MRCPLLRREYAECKARELQRTRKEAEEEEKKLLKLAEDILHQVIHPCTLVMANMFALRTHTRDLQTCKIDL